MRPARDHAYSHAAFSPCCAANCGAEIPLARHRFTQLDRRRPSRASIRWGLHDGGWRRLARVRGDPRGVYDADSSADSAAAVSAQGPTAPGATMRTYTPCLPQPVTPTSAGAMEVTLNNRYVRDSGLDPASEVESGSPSEFLLGLLPAEFVDLESIHRQHLGVCARAEDERTSEAVENPA